jgi:hypothetical protein
MNRMLVAILLAASASVSCAQVPDGLSTTRAAKWEDCPPGTTPFAYYKLVNGRVVRDGWECRRTPSAP